MEKNKLFAKVFLWMFLGLLVTGLSGYYVFSNPNILMNVFGSNVYWILVLIEFGLVVFLATRIRKMSFITAATCFMLYSVITGVTLSSIFVVYELGSIMLIFGLTSLLFLIFGLIGFITKIDFSKFGNILLMALLGLILVTFVNLLLNSSMLETILSGVGVLIFCGLVIYDIQKIKMISSSIEDENKAAIQGALELYLDFINIFIHLLSFFEKSND